MPVPTLSPESQPPLLPSWPGVRLFCSTRLGGVSASPYDSLNLGDHVGDKPEHVARNRALLSQAWASSPVFLNQVHGTQVVQLEPTTPHGTEADACWTQQQGLACTIMVADCLPVLFYQPQARVVAAAHAGWRGLAAGVLETTLETLSSFGMASRWQVWLGPCIGPTAFEVGEEVRAAFASQAPSHGLFQALPTPGKYLADLPALARHRLRQAGVSQIEGNDSAASWCTYTQSELYFSHRRDGRSGRFAVGIVLI